MAAGGQGAPLACAYHQAQFRTSEETRVILNLGGIANITILPADPNLRVSGFDTGPANTLLDAWARRHLGAKYDESGVWASGGTVQQDLLSDMLNDDYLQLPPPKSTGPEHFNLSWLDSILMGHPQVEPQDVQTTLVKFSAKTVVQSILKESAGCDRVIACGGGVHNQALMTCLKNELGNIPIESSSTYGIDPERIEAIAFAWLARRSLLGLPGNIPDVTGASGTRVLGGIYPAGTN
jgi:anhydro-N-acetylmuramic acid kinase